MGSVIKLQDVVKRFPNAKNPAVDGVTLEIGQGEICIFVGPSGCGKTTILRMINRLVEPTSGNIFIEGKDILAENDDELRRNIGYVIQQIGLLPHRTIINNVALVPRLLKWPEEKTKKRVLELLELVGLDPGEVAEKYPHQLSGGQMQRVGVARAMAADPPIMLMDEPFGAVDPIVRSRLQDEFLRIQQNFKKTICFVTHDIDEAMKMGDKVAIINAGKVVQYGTPIEVLSAPNCRFVEDLLGEERGVKLLDLTKCEALMSQDPELLTEALKCDCSVQALKPVKAALEVMMRKDIDAVAVQKGDQSIGVLTWQEIKRHINQISGDNHGV